jgi:hypothetical protein
VTLNRLRELQHCLPQPPQKATQLQLAPDKGRDFVDIGPKMQAQSYRAPHPK